VEKF
jgi:hypothetical protein